MYLTKDFTGGVTKVEYGKQGDHVTVVKTVNEMILIEVNGHRVHVHLEMISNARVESAKEDNSGPAEERVAGNKSHPVKRSRVPRSNGTKGGTGNLFGG
jgi:hypothetical protein